MLIYFHLNSLSFQTGVVSLIVVFTILVIIINMEQLFDPMSIVRIDLEEEEDAGLSSRVKKSDFKREDFEKWRQEYMHPLLINSSGNALNTFNVEVKRLDNVQMEFEDGEGLNRSKSQPLDPQNGTSREFDPEDTISEKVPTEVDPRRRHK